MKRKEELKNQLNQVHKTTDSSTGLVESQVMPIGYWLLVGQTMAVEQLLSELK